MKKDYTEIDVRNCKIGELLISIGKYAALLICIEDIICICLMIMIESLHQYYIPMIIILLISIPISLIIPLLLIGIGTYLNFTYDKCITLKEINDNITNNLNDINTTLEASNVIQVKDIKIRKD